MKKYSALIAAAGILLLVGVGCTSSQPAQPAAQPTTTPTTSTQDSGADLAAESVEAEAEDTAIEPEPAQDNENKIANLENGIDGRPEGTAAYFYNLALPLAKAWHEDAGLKGIVYADMSDKFQIPGMDGFHNWDVRFVSESAPGVWYSVGFVNGEQKSAQENPWVGGDRNNEIVYLESPGIYVNDWNFDSDHIIAEAAKLYGDDSVMMFEVAPTDLTYNPEVDGTAPAGGTSGGTICKVHLKSGSVGYYSKDRMYYDCTTGEYLGKNQ